jgi:hypothetical protein
MVFVYLSAAPMPGIELEFTSIPPYYFSINFFDYYIFVPIYSALWAYKSRPTMPTTIVQEMLSRVS